MANAFKVQQDQAKREKLLADCKAMAKSGTRGRFNAIQIYAREAGVSKEQAERAINMR